MIPEIDWIPLFGFLVATMSSPGPNNVTGASMGVLHGYRKSMQYVLGVGVGLFIVMMLTGLISGLLLSLIPGFESLIRVFGALYIFWLAIGILRSSVLDGSTSQPVLNFSQGIMLQFLNLKVVVMGLTLYSTFLAPLKNQYGWLAISAAGMGILAFFFTSIWTLAGSVLFQNLKNVTVKKLVNLALALLLIYSALELSGLLALFSRRLGG